MLLLYGYNNNSEKTIQEMFAYFFFVSKDT